MFTSLLRAVIKDTEEQPDRRDVQGKDCGKGTKHLCPL